MTPTYTNGDVTLILGDCLEVLPTLADGSVDAVVTDPPYDLSDSRVPVGCGGGVAPAKHLTTAVGTPWGYSTEWVSLIPPVAHWVVFANYAMMGSIYAAITPHAKPSCLFVWRKSNAPPMTRNIPRLDCEFIIWARAAKSSCGTMREFKSMVIDVPMPQAGCMATERVLAEGSKRALHPCQKPLAVVRPFLQRLPIASALDPFMGLGTTGVACVQTGRKFIGIEKEPKYFDIAVKRIEKAIAEKAEQLQFEEAPDAPQA